MERVRLVTGGIDIGQATTDANPQPWRPHKVVQRLSPAVLDELVAAYENGCSCIELAGHYQISKAAVLGLLHQRGVTMRHQPMTPEQVTNARRLYGTGLSVARVADALGLPPRTVHRTLTLAGVQLRDSHGRGR